MFRPQSNNCLVGVRIAVKKIAIEGEGGGRRGGREGGAFLFVEAIPLGRYYYMMSDTASIEII